MTNINNKVKIRLALIALATVLIVACILSICVKDYSVFSADAFSGNISDIIVQGNEQFSSIEEIGESWQRDDTAGDYVVYSASATNASVLTQIKLVFNEPKDHVIWMSFDFQMSSGYKTSWFGSIKHNSSGYAVYSANTQIEGSNGKPSNGIQLLYTDNGNTTVKDSDKVTSNGDWYSALIEVNANATCVFIGFVGTSNKDDVTSSLKIRNLKYILSDRAKVSLSVSNSSGGSVSATETTLDSTPSEVVIGSQLTLSASVNDGYKFYGWTDTDGNYLSESNPYVYTVNSDIDIVAKIEKAGSIPVKGDTGYYDSIQTAIAHGQKNIIVQKGVWTFTEDIKIPEGVTVTISHNDSGTSYTSGGSLVSDFAWYHPEYLYTKVVVNGTITIYGTLVVSGTMYHPGQGYQANTSGMYGELVTNGEVIIANGGTLDIYGLVSGSGHIKVNDGGTLQAPYVVCNFMGGTITKDLYGNNISPFNRYAVVNIQCAQGYTIEGGGWFKAHVELYAASQYNESLVNLIGPSESLFIITSGASISAIYHPNEGIVISDAGNNTNLIGRTDIIFNGGASMGSMSLKINLSGIFSQTVNTSNVFFPVPYNYNITLKSGSYSIKDQILLMPGATLKIDTDASLTVAAAGGIRIYDGFNQPAALATNKIYPSPQQLKAANYTSCGNLVVNGTLTVEYGSEKKGGLLGNKTFVSTLEGPIQTTVEGATIDIKDGVVVSEQISDLQDPATVTMTCTARVWDEAHNKMGELEAGKVYKSTGNSIWTLPKFTTSAGEIDDQQGLHGSWMEVHETHSVNWDVLDSDLKPDESNKVTTATHQCGALGCEHTEKRRLLYTPTALNDVVYKGEEYAADQIKTLIDEYFGTSAEKLNVALDLGGATVCNAATYKLTVTLPQDCMWWCDNTYQDGGKEISLTVDPFELTQANANEIPAQRYNGNILAPQVSICLNNHQLQQGSDYLLSAWSGELKNVGTYTATVSGVGNFAGSFEVRFVIMSKPVTDATVKADPVTYNGQQQTPSVTVDGYSQGDFDVEFAADADRTNVGTVNFTVKFKGNYSGSLDGQFQIQPKNAQDAAVVVETGSFEYSGSAIKPQITVTLQGFENLSENKDYTLAFSDNVNVGTVVVTVNFQNNFTGNAQSNFTIFAAQLSLSVNKQQVVYNGKAQSAQQLSDGWRLDGLKGSDNVTVKLSSVSLISVGKTNLLASLTAERGTKLSNYTVQTALQSQNDAYVLVDGFEVLPHDISQHSTINVSGDHYYQNSAHILNKSNVEVRALDLNLKATEFELQNYQNNVNAGEATFEVHASGNFCGTAMGKFTIKPAAITVTADNLHSPQGEQQNTLTKQLTVGTLYPDGNTVLDCVVLSVDNFDNSLTNKTFVIKAVYIDDGNPANANYSVTTVNGTYTITDSVFVDVVFVGKSVVYDGTEQTLAVSNAPQNSTVEYVYQLNGSNVPAAVNVGEYTVTATVSCNVDGERYTSTFNAKLTITVRSAALTIQPQSVVYNGDVQNVLADQWQIDGLVGGDTVTVVLSGSGKNVGSYDITAEISGDKASNYNFGSKTLKNGFTVTAKQATLTLRNQNAVYNGTEQHVQSTMDMYEWQGLQASDSFVVTVKGSGIDANSYVITAEYSGECAGNYDVDVQSATFTISPLTVSDAEVTFTTLTYNGKQQTPTPTVRVDGRELTVQKDFNVNYIDNVNAGTAKAELTFCGNYSGSVNAEFTISRRSATLTLKAQTATYNGKEQSAFSDSLNYQWSGVVEGDEADLTVTLFGNRKDVGSVKITATVTGSKAENYDILSQNADFTIEKAPLHVTLSDQTVIYTGTVQSAQSDAEFWTLDDDVFEQDDLQLSVEGLGTAAGNYALTLVCHNGNYDVTYNEGEANLIILPKQIVVTMQDETSVYGDELQPFTFDVDGIADADKGTLQINNYLTITGDVTSNRNFGEHTITATATDPQNYTISVIDGTYTVTARDITVTLPSYTRNYNRLPVALSDLGNATAQGLAYSDTVDSLNLSIVIDGNHTLVGSYAVTATWDNANYNVHFVNGVVTIGKYDISEDGYFGIYVGDYANAVNNVLNVGFAGEALPVSGYALYYADENWMGVVQPSVAQIDGCGTFTVVLTVIDDNYTGSQTFTVIAEEQKVDNLQRVLDRLEQIAGTLSKDELAVDNFGTLKEVKSLIDSLSAEEQKQGELKLAPYKQLLEAWDALADVDETVIDTAEAIVSAPIKGLMLVASLNALLAAAVAVLKGGIR